MAFQSPLPPAEQPPPSQPTAEGGRQARGAPMTRRESSPAAPAPGAGWRRLPKMKTDRVRTEDSACRRTLERLRPPCHSSDSWPPGTSAGSQPHSLEPQLQPALEPVQPHWSCPLPPTAGRVRSHTVTSQREHWLGPPSPPPCPSGTRAAGWVGGPGTQGWRRACGGPSSFSRSPVLMVTCFLHGP